MSWKIRIQIALLWLLPLMFSTCNIWMVIHQKSILRKDKDPTWIFTEYTICANMFWLEHWLYVSMYMRVALLMPFTFCLQTERVK